MNFNKLHLFIFKPGNLHNFITQFFWAVTALAFQFFQSSNEAPGRENVSHCCCGYVAQGDLATSRWASCYVHWRRPHWCPAPSSPLSAALQGGEGWGCLFLMPGGGGRRRRGSGCTAGGPVPCREGAYSPGGGPWAPLNLCTPLGICLSVITLGAVYKTPMHDPALALSTTDLFDRLLVRFHCSSARLGILASSFLPAQLGK